MAGTKSGGIKASQKIKSIYGADFYARIGAIGGRRSRNGGFAADRERARSAGSAGGKISKAGYMYVGVLSDGHVYIHRATGKRLVEPLAV